MIRIRPTMLGLVAVLVACSPASPEALAPGRAAAERDAVPVGAEEGDQLPVRNVAPAERKILEAIEWRQRHGLRADREWVEQVARRADTNHNFGVPLTGPEALAYTRGPGPVVRPIADYCDRHSEACGGFHLTGPADSVVVIGFTRDAETHEAAIRALVDVPLQLMVRDVANSQSDLRRLEERISQEDAFLRAIPAKLLNVNLDVQENRVDVWISSADPDAERVTTERLGGSSIVKVHSDGTGVALLPRGRIAGQVVDRRGRPVAGLAVWHEDPDTGVVLDSVGWSTGVDGSFVLEPVIAGRYRVVVGEPGGWISAARMVRVAPGGIARVRLVADPAPPAPAPAPTSGITAPSGARPPWSQ